MVDIEELCNLYVSPIYCLGGEIKETKICKKVHSNVFVGRLLKIRSYVEEVSLRFRERKLELKGCRIGFWY
jgi:hypothetical protein